ncbi:MAG: DUF4469 domain-containing protein [Prevotellaceae bacterium]|jgi:hypothetical protein|nr:DUF4469 domain-containing protein [Prevotellaceae bacterium]
MPVLHSIKAKLYNNPLTDNPNDMVIRPDSERSLSVREICETAVARGHADISAPAIEHATDIFLGEMGYQLCDGFTINTGWFTAAPQIRGVVEDPNEHFDPAKHTLIFEFHQGALLRKEMENVTVEIIGVADVDATIGQVIDVKTGSVNDLLTPNRNLKISGHKLKIVGTNVANGIYFVNSTTAVRTRVDPSDIVINNPSELIIVIPALAAGVYHLEVTTQYAVGSVLREPRTAQFNKPLTVE